MACRCLLVGLATIGLAGCSALLGIDEAVHQPDAAVDALEPCVAIGAQCVGEDVLRTCASVGQLPTDEACAWGCTAGGEARCARLVPTGGVLRSTDLTPSPALWPTTITGPVGVNTDDGEIQSVRAPGEGVENGIGFERRGGVAVFSFRSLAVEGPVSVTGGLAVAFVAAGDITVNGVIDLRGGCAENNAGPGGRPGGMPGAAAEASAAEGAGRPTSTSPPAAAAVDGATTAAAAAPAVPCPAARPGSTTSRS